ncbi:hypothetical protein BDR07DRAFT_1485009 [Suillus spraguei]|nr:hypothetical protein BDR07DRAFT_1485009 [Suillus spraguei]
MSNFSSMDSPKKQYSVVKNIKSLSGFSWDDERSVSVTPETSGAWDAHTKAHLQSKPFSSKGFLHFNTVEELMLTAAKGNFVTSSKLSTKTNPNPIENPTSASITKLPDEDEEIFFDAIG